ncbi:MAG: hypothetical protein DBX55_03355 [Verrucomicrobia bacterium]|nr:MAG: hypothetical protein DBX55_03355 [Verrucomicrobiota bacterium]
MPIIFSALSPIMFSSASRAANYYFNVAALDESTASFDFTSQEALDYWYTDSSFTQKAEALPDFTGGTDTLYFTGAAQANYLNLYSSINLKLESLFQRSDKTVLTTAEGGVIETTGDLTIGAGGATGYIMYIGGSNNTRVVVGGNFSFSGGSMGNNDSRIGSIASLTVNGDVTLYSHGTNFPKIYASSEATFENPNVIIKGAIKSQSPRAGYDTQALMYGGTNNNVESITNNSYMWVNGFDNYAGVTFDTGTSYTGSLTVVLTNSNSYTSLGGMGTKYSGSTQLNAKLNLTMNSCVYGDSLEILEYRNATQSFRGSDMKINGDVEIISGGLFLNYSSADAATLSRGALKLSKASNAQTAIFGNSNVTADETSGTSVGGTFAFSGLEVNGGGTVRVRIDSASDGSLVWDAISLSGGATGSGTVIIHLTDEAGGDFEDYSKIICNNPEEGIKVISWTQAADDGIVFTTDEQSRTITYEGADYVFTTFKGEDGLYVSYTVPEPAEWAAILSFAVLAAAFLRRRRRR